MPRVRSNPSGVAGGGPVFEEPRVVFRRGWSYCRWTRTRGGPVPSEDRTGSGRVGAIKIRRSRAFVVATAVVLSSTVASAAGGSPARSTADHVTVLQAKRIVSGVVGGGCIAFKAGDQCAATASISPTAPRNVNEATMGVQGGTFENPFCAGDIARPAPTRGYLCIYPSQAELVNVGLTNEGLISAEPHPIYNGRRGFKVVWAAQAPGSTQFYAVWAYRAP